MTNEITTNGTETLEPSKTAYKEVFGVLAAIENHDYEYWPDLSKVTEAHILGEERVGTETLIGYATYKKLTSDRHIREGRPPYYGSVLDDIAQMSEENLASLYSAQVDENPLHDMLQHELGTEISRVRTAVDVIKIARQEHVTSILSKPDGDPTAQHLADMLKEDLIRPSNVFKAALGSGEAQEIFKPGTQARRELMRQIVISATEIEPELADAYIYQASRTSFIGDLHLDTIVDRIRTYDQNTLEEVYEFSGISTLAAYSETQIERMHKLALADKAEIERLQNHDVIVMFVNMDGDHNGMSSEVAARMDDGSERIVFFEISDPSDIYKKMKQLHDLGVAPSTLMFAAHGGEGQFAIGKRPDIHTETTSSHVTSIQDQWFLDEAVAKLHSKGEESIAANSVANANGLIRSIQRFMIPSRAIDDNEQDIGRKKIISLSCGFDQADTLIVKNEKGVNEEKSETTLMRSLGEVIMKKLTGENIDVYGADISTNSQTRTVEGFHYNTLDRENGGARIGYPASVLRIDGNHSKYEKVTEVKLRKPQE